MKVLKLQEFLNTNADSQWHMYDNADVAKIALQQRWVLIGQSNQIFKSCRIRDL